MKHFLSTKSFPLSFRIVFEESIFVVDFLAKFPKIGTNQPSPPKDPTNMIVHGAFAHPNCKSYMHIYIHSYIIHIFIYIFMLKQHPRNSTTDLPKRTSPPERGSSAAVSKAQLPSQRTADAPMEVEAEAEPKTLW